MARRDMGLGESLPSSWKIRYEEIAPGVFVRMVAVHPIDDISGFSGFISVGHSKIHGGDAFDVSHKSAEGADVANDADLDMLLVTTTATAHMVFGIQAGGDCEVLFYEDTVTTGDGTAILEANLNRTSTNVATVTATYTPTVAGGVEGTLLHNSLIAGGTGGNASGGSAAIRWDAEWVLATGKKYMIRATNRAGGAKPISIVAQWYEV